MANDNGEAKLDRVLVLEVARVTEVAAIAAARLRGRGNEKAADKAAVDAMRRELGRVSIRGKVVIGEGEMDEAPMLYIGEEVGNGTGPQVDIAVDPLEGTTICAKSMPNALAVLAISERGGLLHAPDMYMNKIAIGRGIPKASSTSMLRLPITSRRLQRRRACRSARSRLAFSTGRVMPTSSRRCATQALPCGSFRTATSQA